MKKRAFGKLYKEFFYIPKHEKLPPKVFRCRMVLSLLTILACIAVMAASTFALFYSEVSTDRSTIASAYYSVTVENTENETYICPLAFEDKHTFEIQADGTATTGYCKIRVGEKIYYTEQIFQGQSLVLTVQAAQGTVITFTPQWGVSSNYISETTCGDAISHSATPSTTYTVEPTARLSNIAAHYGVSETDILTYNNISEIAVGMELKIPGATTETRYAVPYAVYIMQDGATLDNIALHYDVSIDDIQYYNNYPNLTVGYELKIPGVVCDYPAYNYVAPIPDSPVADDTVSDGEDNGGDEPTEESAPIEEETESNIEAIE